MNREYDVADKRHYYNTLMSADNKWWTPAKAPVSVPDYIKGKARGWIKHHWYHQDWLLYLVVCDEKCRCWRYAHNGQFAFSFARPNISSGQALKGKLDAIAGV